MMNHFIVRLKQVYACFESTCPLNDAVPPPLACRRLLLEQFRRYCPGSRGVATAAMPREKSCNIWTTPDPGFPTFKLLT